MPAAFGLFSILIQHHSHWLNSLLELPRSSWVAFGFLILHRGSYFRTVLDLRDCVIRNPLTSNFFHGITKVCGKARLTTLFHKPIIHHITNNTLRRTARWDKLLGLKHKKRL